MYQKGHIILSASVTAYDQGQPAEPSSFRKWPLFYNARIYSCVSSKLQIYSISVSNDELYIGLY